MQGRETEEENFQKSLSFWTLSFYDPEEESRFMKKFDTSLRMPTFFRVMVYMSIAFQFLIRLYKMYGIIRGLKIPSGTFYEELISLIVYGFGCIAEIFIHYTGFLKQIKGLFLYIVLPVISVYAGFTTNKGPYLGVMYFYNLYF